jgi:hypothetical protein
MSCGMSSDAALPIRFFTRADSKSFIGLLALVRSLRLQGHDEALTVLDLGLTAHQRSVLEGQCDVVRVPGIARRHPWLVAPYPYLLNAEGTVVYLDCDVIVTSRLDHALAAARRGLVCAAPDPATRWFADWESIFAIKRSLRREVYVNSGFVAFSTLYFLHLQRRWWECCDRMAQHLDTPPSGNATRLHCHQNRANPIALPDQDALNALLMSEVPAGRVQLLPKDAVGQGRRELAQIIVVDLRRLESGHAGRRTTLFHAWGRPKPWQAKAWRNLTRTPYVRFLRRLLSGADVRGPIDTKTVPV